MSVTYLTMCQLLKVPFLHVILCPIASDLRAALERCRLNPDIKMGCSVLGLHTLQQSAQCNCRLYGTGTTVRCLHFENVPTHLLKPLHHIHPITPTPTHTHTLTLFPLTHNHLLKVA